MGDEEEDEEELKQKEEKKKEEEEEEEQEQEEQEEEQEGQEQEEEQEEEQEGTQRRRVPSIRLYIPEGGEMIGRDESKQVQSRGSRVRRCSGECPLMKLNLSQVGSSQGQL